MAHALHIAGSAHVPFRDERISQWRHCSQSCKPLFALTMEFGARYNSPEAVKPGKGPHRVARTGPVNDPKHAHVVHREAVQGDVRALIHHDRVCAGPPQLQSTKETLESAL